MFTTTELDNETSYTYFGARYYDADLSIWLSVDPMSDKYGVDFAVNYFDPESDLTFGEQLENYLNNLLNAVNPKDGPNYEKLPTKDTSNPPTRTNKTTVPIDTKENP